MQIVKTLKLSIMKSTRESLLIDYEYGILEYAGTGISSLS